MAYASKGWKSFIHEWPDVGVVVHLMFRDPMGTYEAPGRRYFLHDDGAFYLIDPPMKIEKKPAYWRVTE